jgi:hypothetical protein
MPSTKYLLQENLARIGDPSRVISDFLAWAEQQRGLALCKAYKPKYAWYTPTATPLETLLADFGAQHPAARNADSRPVSTSGHGRPSRRAMLAPGKPGTSSRSDGK